MIYIVGNKSDLEDKCKISSEEAIEKANQLGVGYIETSALSGNKIDLLFNLIGNHVINQI